MKCLKLWLILILRYLKKIFRRYVRESFSYFDLSQKMPENVYHAFTLGLLVSLDKTHQVLSNRESGYGRYDVMVIPIDPSKTGIIIEFKKYDEEDEESLEELIQEAKEQIESKKYETELLSRGISDIKKLVIVFKGKEAFVNDVTE
ncbi:MAG: PD-(D/E)XK nuclease domain-containing protein [Paraclostridium sp.]